uniref:Uncharacterized protein n=1 Tax=Salmonella phage vB_SEnST11_KE23 TaxID=3161174 RepID=A0AAU8GG13_9CAUD
MAIFLIVMFILNMVCFGINLRSMVRDRRNELAWVCTFNLFAAIVCIFAAGLHA